MTFDLFQYSILFITLLITAFLVTPVFRSIARKFKILDYPGGRKLQDQPVAYLGGLAVITPITIASILLLFTALSLDMKQQLFLGLILPSLVIAFVGLLDDIYHLPPWLRFVSQTAVGSITSILLYSSGAGIKIFENQFLNITATVFWVVTIINAINFMDNMDGLASTICIVSSFTFFILTYLNNQFLVAALSLSISASCMGFLFWNKKPATIYLGDAGALYLGFLLSAVAIRIDLNSELVINRVFVLLLPLALPIIDITQVVISRLLKGKSAFQGGRDHISHVLLDRGYSQGKVLMILTTLSIIFSSIALFIAEVV